MNSSPFEYLDRHIRENPRSIMFFPSRLTFGEAHQKIEMARQRFAQSGMKPGDRCLMVTPVGDQFHIHLIALLQYGAIPVLIDLALGWKLVLKSLRGIGLRYLVTEQKVLRIPGRNRSFTSSDEGDILYFTSGSTGLPKPVFYRLCDLWTQVQMLRRSRYEFDKQSIFNLKEARSVEGRILYGYSSLPVFGFYQLLMGMGIWSRPLQTGKELQEALSGENKGILTDLCLNPKILGDWLRFINSKYLSVSDSLERIVIVSAPLPKPALEQLKLKLPLHCSLEQTYGCTEAFPISQRVYSDPDRPPYGSSMMATVGPVLRDWGLELRSPSHRYVMEEKIHPPIQQIWIQDLRSRWVNTGDLGFQNESGELVVLGREKFTYRFGEKTYFSLLWELKAREIPEVKDAVLMQENPNQRPTLVVSLRRRKAIPVNLGVRQTASELVVPRKRSVAEVCRDLLHQLEIEFGPRLTSEVELLLAKDLPVDPRHQIKILRERIWLPKLRWSLRNLLRRKINNIHLRKELV